MISQRIDSSMLPCFVEGDDFHTELPQHIIDRWNAEAKEKCENYRELSARIDEAIKTQLEQMALDQLNR